MLPMELPSFDAIFRPPIKPDSMTNRVRRTGWAYATTRWFWTSSSSWPVPKPPCCSRHGRKPVVRENLICRPRGAREATCPLSRLALDPCETHPATMDHASQGFGVSDAEVEANESHDNRVSGLIGPTTPRANSRGAGRQEWAERPGERFGRQEPLGPPAQAAPGMPGCPSTPGEVETRCSR